MVSDLVAGAGHLPRHLGQPPHLRAALEERRADAVPPQQFQKLRGGLTRPVVKGQRDGRPAMPRHTEGPNSRDERPRTP
jgi:hypothetical protein